MIVITLGYFVGSIATAIFVTTIWATRVSLGSVLASASLTPLADATGAPREATMAAAAATSALIVFWHRGNLVRLARRTERRLGEGA